MIYITGTAGGRVVRGDEDVQECPG